MATKTSVKTKPPTKYNAKSTTALLKTRVDFKSPIFIATMVMFVALGAFFILKTFAAGGVETWDWTTPGIKYRMNDKLYMQVRVNSTTVKRLPVANTVVPQTPTTVWFGPYRNMVVPAGYHGIQACYRYALDVKDSQPPAGFVDKVTYDMTINLSRTVLAKNYKTYDISTPSTFDSQGNLIYEKHCLQYAAKPGTRLNGVETRITYSQSVFRRLSTSSIYIVNTELSYY